jgi:ClpP class serine protease
MTVNFLVKNNDNEEKEIQFSMDKTILDLKKEIIKQYNLKCKALDIFIDLEVPLRGMGKYTLEKGLIQRAMDSYSMNKFNVEKKNIVITFQELENDYSLNSVKKSNFGKGNYVPPRLRKHEEITVKEKNLDLNDLNEFPPLS